MIFVNKNLNIQIDRTQKLVLYKRMAKEN